MFLLMSHVCFRVVLALFDGRLARLYIFGCCWTLAEHLRTTKCRSLSDWVPRVELFLAQVTER